MSLTVENVKKNATIEPKDCKCLPEMAQHIIEFALEDKIHEYQSALEAVDRAIRKFPGLAIRRDEITKQDDQYQRGLVSAIDLTSTYFPSNLVRDELQDNIAAYKHFTKQIHDMPTCGYPSRPIEPEVGSKENPLKLGGTMREIPIEQPLRER